MFCTSCGREMASEDAFCPKCGTASGAAPTARAAAGPHQRLARSVRNKKIAGVCGGFANYFGMDVTLVRVLWLITVLCVGTGILAYIVCWIVMPLEDVQAAVTVTPQRV
jgi:phage shock protein C